jgi:hypothetical protein
MGNPWISWFLLALVYLTYGRFLQAVEVGSVGYTLIVSGLFAIALAAVLTILWPSAQQLMLLGFQSDAGYFIMVLSIASLSVFAVVEFRIFSYIVMLMMASLLARVDTLINGLSNSLAFGVLVAFPLLGLSLSLLPALLHPAAHESARLGLLALP